MCYGLITILMSMGVDSLLSIFMTLVFTSMLHQMEGMACKKVEELVGKWVEGWGKGLMAPGTLTIVGFSLFKNVFFKVVGCLSGWVGEGLKHFYFLSFSSLFPNTWHHSCVLSIGCYYSSVHLMCSIMPWILYYLKYKNLKIKN